MTILGWTVFAILAVVIVCFTFFVFMEADSVSVKVVSILVGIALIVALFFGMRWYFSSTASGQRAMTDQKADFGNGLERTITIYTADGKVIAQYTGKIDIEGNAGGYVLFDFEGKRYTYYNCFVESIADID